MPFPIEDVLVNRKVAKVTLRGVRDKPGIAAIIFEELSSRGVNVEMIVTGASAKGRTDIAFLVLESQIDRIKEIEEELLQAIDARDLSIDRKVALIVFYGGSEMAKTPGVAARIFNILAEAGVNIEMISTSIDSLSLVVRENRIEEAIFAIGENLGIEPREEYF